jgi:N-methylhydantoinase A
MPSREFAVAVDIGGTFTDVTSRDLISGQSWRAKTPSTPSDPSEAFITGVRSALTQCGADAADVVRVLHGTTVATNLILEGKTARAALVTTAGFRHVLEIGRQDIPRAANLFAWVKPRRPVPPERVVEVIERVGAGGMVLRPLDETSVHLAAETLRQMNVQTVAVCLLHAFAFPSHERRVAELLRVALPGVEVTASVDVLPVAREYERSLATILNAGVMPAVTTYIRRLLSRLTEAGIAAPLLLMQSNGGVAGSAAVTRAPALTVLSGPAAGVVGARNVAMSAGVGDIITVDIGGTSADICLMRGGRIELTQRGRIGEWPLPLPMVDMVTIGAGGGSIAQLIDGALLVGPHSAGAFPGPACYGLGGTDATVTDAHVVLGHLPGALLGGLMKLDAALAEQAVSTRVAEPLGLSPHDAASGILAIANANMVGAIRVVSVERGHDPREVTLMPFGGAGPLHGCALAELLGIESVLIPPAPGILCAEGLLAAQLRAEFSRTMPGTEDWDIACSVFVALEQEATAWFEEERVPLAGRCLDRVALLRYAGQGAELTVPWIGDQASMREAFEAVHQRLNGFVLPTRVELVTLRVEASSQLAGPEKAALLPRGGPSLIGSRTVWFEAGPFATEVHERTALNAGDRIAGPAVVLQLDATTLVAPGWIATVLSDGSLLMRHQHRPSPAAVSSAPALLPDPNDP